MLKEINHNRRRSLFTVVIIIAAAQFGMFGSAKAQSGKMEPAAPPDPDAGSYARKFSGKYAHMIFKGGVGHNPPQEAPLEFARAVIEVSGY